MLDCVSSTVCGAAVIPMIIVFLMPMCYHMWLRGRAVVLQPEGRQFDPSLPHLHAGVSLGKMLNPELPLIEQQRAAHRCTV